MMNMLRLSVFLSAFTCLIYVPSAWPIELSEPSISSSSHAHYLRATQTKNSVEGRLDSNRHRRSTVTERIVALFEDKNFHLNFKLLESLFLSGRVSSDSTDDNYEYDNAAFQTTSNVTSINAEESDVQVANMEEHYSENIDRSRRELGRNKWCKFLLPVLFF